MRGKDRKLLAATAGSGFAAAAYFLLVRRWHLRWGATDEEVARAMPLDERIPRPTYVTNRAITIRAAPERVWPWLAQMGELPRGGFYSYAPVERLLKLKVENATRILPDCQHLEVGQALDHAGTMVVQEVEPNRHLVLGPPPGSGLKTTWALGLYETPGGDTRLVSRCRAWLPRTPKGMLWLMMLDPGQFVMERKMLLEIRRLVESAEADADADADTKR